MARHLPAPAFAAVLEQLRISRQLSPADLARGLDVSPTLVSRWRRGTSVPSIQAIEQLATFFGVDRGTLESLAGYRASKVDVANDTIDPEIGALLDEERTQLHNELHGIPRAFWQTVLSAQRTARRMAVDMARTSLEISSSKAPELADPKGDLGREGQGGKDGPGGTLAISYQLAGVH